MIPIEEDSGPSGAPAWMSTFADLMSLLMCFFVLLLSFSEMDVLKYKQVAGSMRDAFGVQSQVKVMDIPKGTSIIAQEFSPGKSEPTLIKTINQVSTETIEASLRVGNPTAPVRDTDEFSTEQVKELLQKKLEYLKAETKADAKKLEKILENEIIDGKVDIESQNRIITIRIRENGSFPSGSATLSPEFLPVMAVLRKALMDIDGIIAVEGHTDDVPFTSGQFRSNWGLSSSRALTVTHELVKDKELDASRFMVVGHADNQPFKPNTSAENRARNRRVEIIIRQGIDDTTAASINDLQQSNQSVMDIN
jgi:chemotaxis protein MotB